MHTERSTPADLPFRRALDLLDSGIGFYRGDLTLIFGNEAFGAMLREDHRLGVAVDQILRELTGMCRLVGRDGEVKTLVDREVRSADATLRIRGGCVGIDIWATGGSLVITVEPVVVANTTEPEEIAKRFGLTQREAELAVLLGDGHSNEQIAEQLYLSPHTVRNYTRQVLRKLRVRSRAQVGPRIRSK